VPSVGLLVVVRGRPRILRKVESDLQRRFDDGHHRFIELPQLLFEAGLAVMAQFEKDCESPKRCM
jgi:hypothetical protein